MWIRNRSIRVPPLGLLSGSNRGRQGVIAKVYSEAKGKWGVNVILSADHEIFGQLAIIETFQKFKLATFAFPNFRSVVLKLNLGKLALLFDEDHDENVKKAFWLTPEQIQLVSPVCLLSFRLIFRK